MDYSRAAPAAPHSRPSNAMRRRSLVPPRRCSSARTAGHRISIRSSIPRGRRDSSRPMTFELSIINGKTVFDIVRAHRAECIDVVEAAYLAHAKGHAINPHSYFLRFPEKPDCRIIALPAFLGDGFSVAWLEWFFSYTGHSSGVVP